MDINDMKLRGADYRIVAVSSMEQIIGGALSTVISVMLPMLQLTLHPKLPSLVQGVIGATGLIGIGIGSYILGKISDRKGYLFTFRLCPAIIMLGALLLWLFPSVPCLVAALLITGIGVGGGYSLDSSYISELLPAKWRLFMVGVAKASCCIGFIGAAVACVVILHSDADPAVWNHMILITGALGLLTLLLRIRWWESPKWLLARGLDAKAQQAARNFLGPDAQVSAESTPASGDKGSDKPARFSIRQNLAKVIFSGIPWACEGLGVYGFSVFLPVMVMALGINAESGEGVHRIVGSVEVTAVVNFFMLPGFILGLCLVRKRNNVRMMGTGFVFAAAGLALLLAAYALKWSAIWMLAGFVIFEVALNAGPHLITFIIPSRIYPVALRAEGSGVAALMGKVGAVVGVILMPVMLELGGMLLVLIVSTLVMLSGALISFIYGRKLGLLDDATTI